jgi:Melibiase
VRRALLGLVLVAVVPTAPAQAAETRDGTTYVRTSEGEVVIGNAFVERRFAREGHRTTQMTDRRGANVVLEGAPSDFTLSAGALDITSDRFDVADVSVKRLPRGGLRATMTLTGVPGMSVERIAEVEPGVNGFTTQTIVTPAAALALSSVVLEEVAPRRGSAQLHAFRAGADWREPEWEGPPVQVGDPHAGTWRQTTTGDTVEGSGQWLSVAAKDRSLFLVSEGTDFPSARGAYDGATAQLRADYGQDVILLGPLEESAHVENPAGPRGPRQRVVQPGQTLALDRVFTGFGAGDGDEAWQFAKHLRRGLLSTPGEVVFNSNDTDSNRISTGAKDDMDIATVRDTAPVARRLGIETFVLDDGWQARSGDWEPDSPEFPEPRGTPPRFPDARFEAVREAIAPMKLGLWMSPMHFHPSSEAGNAHREWHCQPTGAALELYNRGDAESSSNEAGIVPWGPAAIPHVESRIRHAITEWGVSYFKFDFLAWLDCAGQGDLYAFRDAFVAMLDRIRADHPAVTLQIDETNDYRLFPFASTSRGPTWFQNGHPDPHQLLHNLWNVSPYVPTYALGQHVLGGSGWKDHPVSTSMAAALASHISFFVDVRKLAPEVVDEASRWLAFYKQHRTSFTAGVTYPLLDDPLEKSWTALQTWDADRARGALLAFRQDSDDAARTIALRNVEPGRTFDVISAPDGAVVDTVTSAQLREGLRVEIGAQRGARVLVLQPRRG